MLGIKPSTFSLYGRLSRGEEDNGPEAAMGCRGRRQSLFGRRAHQRDGVAMANKFRQLRVVPKPQREDVAVARDDDGFPPAVVQGFLGDDEMTRTSWLKFKKLHTT